MDSLPYGSHTTTRRYLYGAYRSLLRGSQKYVKSQAFGAPFVIFLTALFDHSAEGTVGTKPARQPGKSSTARYKANPHSHVCAPFEFEACFKVVFRYR